MKKLFVLILALTLNAAAQTTQQYRTGLDTLHDDRLINELASRGLTDLLERAFEVNHVPEEKRAAIRATAALRQLNDEDVNLAPAQRRQLISSIAAGIEQALPMLDDPHAMMQQAGLLIRHGVEPDVNVLEYWGENPRSAASLQPVARAVIKLLTRTEELAKAQADALGNQLTGPDDPRSRLWEDYNAIAANAAYTKHMVMYALVLSLGADSDERLDTANQAVEYLKQFDNPASTVQPTVRGRIGRLLMARGNLQEAQDIFSSLINPPADMQPRPDWSQQFDARYFFALCDLLGSRLSDAHAKLQELNNWQQSNPAPDAKTRDGTTAALAMLSYRLTLADAQAAPDPAQQQKLAADARSILLALVQRRRDLSGVIYDQLLSRLPADADIKALDPLLLQAIVQRADNERLKLSPEKPDPATLQRGIAAARQLLTYRGRADIDVELTSAAALLIPLFQEKLGYDIEAAEGLLDYLRDFGATRKNSTLALDAAQSVIGRLRADPRRSEDPRVRQAYERFLSVALAQPFSRRELAFDYARLLQSQGKYKEAAEYFNQVPPDDARVVTARFYQLVCTRQRMDDPKLDPAERQKVLKSVNLLADQVAAMAENALSRAASRSDKDRYRGIIVRSMLLSADVARRENNDPQRTLTLLEDIDRAAAGLPGESELLASALYTRIQAHLSLGQTEQATASLVKLIQNKSGNEGATIAGDVMQRLNRELEQAQGSGDRKRAAEIASNRATLSAFLADWAKGNPDPATRQLAHRYRLFSATARRQAAQLIEQPDARTAQLREALELYRKLEAASPDVDPQISLGIGLIAFDLGDYPESQRRLGQLLLDHKLGSPTTVINDNGAERTIENDTWWEATLKLLRCNLEIAKANPSDPSAQRGKEQTITYLKQLYVQWGAKTGGAKWHADFERLRTELIPDFTSNS